MERALLWPRSPRATRWLDLALCAGAVAVGLGGQVAASSGVAVSSSPLQPVATVGAIGAGVALGWRRSRPLLTLGLIVVLVIVVAGASPPGLYGVQVALVVAVACFALGAWSEHRRAVIAAGAALVGVTVLGAAGEGGGWAASLAIALALIALPIVAGVAARARRRELEEVETRLAEAERRQGERELLAIQEERTRIARELHDVVAHHVSLIGVQAGAARATLGTSPEATRDALAAIEESSRAAVGEMRQLVDVLQPMDAGDRSPQPGLGDLGALIDRWRAAGVAVTLDTADVGELAPTLSLSCYRVVEEALTNVARHSSARRASVAVRPTASTIEIAVVDPGPAVAADAAPDGDRRGGRGLVGMAERAALFGGTVAAGPTTDGGFAVLASLPRVAPA